MPERQHHIPAVLLAQFGKPASNGRVREATVAVRRRSGPAVIQSVESIGWRRGLYDLTDSSYRDPGFVDKLWDELEHSLRPAVSRLQAHAQTTEDHLTIRAYIASSGVRHPTFAEHADRERRAVGAPALSGDDVQFARVETFDRASAQLEGWGMRVLYRPDDAHPFAVSDFGWSKFHVVGEPAIAFVFPLSSDVAVLAYPDRDQFGPDHRSGLDAHFVVEPSVVDIINVTPWVISETSWLAIHPNSLAYLDQIEDYANVGWPYPKPFRDRNGGLFD